MKTIHKLAYLLFSLAVASSTFSRSNVYGQDWRGWRGPSGQGDSIETKLPERWSETENVAWKTAIPGLGWSSPIVVADRVFVTSATDNGESCRVICLDRRRGKIQWETLLSVGDRRNHDRRSLAAIRRPRAKPRAGFIRGIARAVADPHAGAFVFDWPRFAVTSPRDAIRCRSAEGF